MRTPFVNLRAYVLMVGALGAVLLLSVFPGRPPDPQSGAVLFLFAVLLLLADLNPVWLPQGAIVSVSAALNFSNTLLFGPSWAAWVGTLAVAAADLRQHRPWYKVLFNSSCTALSVGLGGIVYLAVQDGVSPPLQSSRDLLGAGLYALTNFGLNSLLVSVVIGLDQRVSPWLVWRANSSGSLLQFAAMMPLGVLIASAYLQFSLWSALLLVLPLIMVYKSLRVSQDLRNQTRGVIEALADVVDRRDPYTDRHSQEVAELSTLIARRIQLPLEEQEVISSAARIHDLGKIATRDAVLLKPGRLDREELEEMRQHPSVGAEIVSHLAFYDRCQNLILHHQERYDGRGYPSGLRGVSIPLGARIIAVADAYQAMTSDRPYRSALPWERAVAEILAGKGTQFDPEVVDAFLAALGDERVATLRTVVLPERTLV